jgi:hypothetical protein
MGLFNASVSLLMKWEEAEAAAKRAEAEVSSGRRPGRLLYSRCTFTLRLRRSVTKCQRILQVELGKVKMHPQG